MKVRRLKLYLLVLTSAFVVFVIALGGGLFSQQAQWQYHLFTDLCHQLPDRSFWLNGQPMAVCSRCLGIYSGFAFGWMLLPIAGIRNFASDWSMKKGALIAVIINFLDIIGNILSLWENTLVSRLVLGGAIGTTVALIFLGDFFKSHF